MSLLCSRVAFQGTERAYICLVDQSGNINIQAWHPRANYHVSSCQGTFNQPITVILRQEHSRGQIIQELIIFTSCDLVRSVNYIHSHVLGASYFRTIHAAYFCLLIWNNISDIIFLLPKSE